MRHQTLEHRFVRNVPRELDPGVLYISMDYATVALDQAPEAAPGDEVVCLGGEGPSAITVESWAQLKGTHPYEIICSFGNRVRRCYTNP